MEEQKNKGKEIKMQPTKGTNQDSTKQPELTKDQLKDAVDKLLNDNRTLRQQNYQMNQALMSIEKLDYLLRVISVANSCKEYSFNTDFVQKCIDEVQKIMTDSGAEQNPEATKEN